MAISPQQLTIYLCSAHRAVTFAIAQLSCLDKCVCVHSILICKFQCCFAIISREIELLATNWFIAKNWFILIYLFGKVITVCNRTLLYIRV